MHKPSYSATATAYRVADIGASHLDFVARCATL